MDAIRLPAGPGVAPVTSRTCVPSPRDADTDWASSVNARPVADLGPAIDSGLPKARAGRSSMTGRLSSRSTSLDLCSRLSRRSHTNARIRPRIRPTASPLGSTRLFLGELGCAGTRAAVTMWPPEVSEARVCSEAILPLRELRRTRSDDRVD